MSSSFPEIPEDAPNFAPTTDFPVDEDQALEDIENSIDTFPDEVDLIVTAEAPQPIGRSYAFDWRERRFIPSSRAHGPLATAGEQTLVGWIEKCLRTARGAHPIHPPEYGFDNPGGLLGGRVGQVPPDLEKRIQDALTFHERISAIEDFSFAFEPNADFLQIEFTVVLDDNEELPINTSLELGI